MSWESIFLLGIVIFVPIGLLSVVIHEVRTNRPKSKNSHYFTGE